MKKIVLAALCAIALTAGAAAATDIRFSPTTTQTAFKEASKELGMGISFTNNAPPHALGITGFDAGVELSLVELDKSAAAFDGNAPDYLVLPKLHVKKGLPFGINIGAMYSNGGNTNVQLYGVEASKDLLEGGFATPALAIRGSYTKLAGIGDLDLQTAGVDASVGKGFLMFTPYGGAGYTWIDSRYTGTAVAGLKSESLWLPRGFVGVEIKPFPLLRINAEAEYAVRPVYSLKAAVGF
jgi:hypothetical protein